MTNLEMKEMLEMAAKACGHEGEYYIIEDSVFGLVEEGIGDNGWNPYIDDGDYSRMEAQLEMYPKWLKDRVIVRIDNPLDAEVELCSDHNGDKQAARRAAGTRLAAEIGRTMK